MFRRIAVHFNNSFGVPECYEKFFENDAFDVSRQLEDQVEDSQNDSSNPIRKVEINLDSHFGVPTCYTSFFRNLENDNSE